MPAPAWKSVFPVIYEELHLTGHRHPNCSIMVKYFWPWPKQSRCASLSS